MRKAARITGSMHFYVWGQNSHCRTRKQQATQRKRLQLS